MEEHIRRNMIMMGLSQCRTPRCLQCGYFFMDEKLHEYYIDDGGITYFECPNCGFATNTRVIFNDN